MYAMLSMSIHRLQDLTGSCAVQGSVENKGWVNERESSKKIKSDFTDLSGALSSIFPLWSIGSLQLVNELC